MEVSSLCSLYPESYPENEEEIDDDCRDVPETQLHAVSLSSSNVPARPDLTGSCYSSTRLPVVRSAGGCSGVNWSKLLAGLARFPHTDRVLRCDITEQTLEKAGKAVFSSFS